MIGTYFLYIWGPAILPLGVLGLFLVVSYTKWITRHPFFCLIAPGFGFGILWVMGTDFVLTGTYSISAFFASLVPFFLVTDLLLLNQFPDVEADKTVGRRHLPILIGKRKSNYIYVAFLAMAYLSLILGVLFGYLPKFSLFGLLTIFLAIFASFSAVRFCEDTSKLMPALTTNVLINLLTPLFTSIGLFTECLLR